MEKETRELKYSIKEWTVMKNAFKLSLSANEKELNKYMNLSGQVGSTHTLIANCIQTRERLIKLLNKID
jgi:hypothetical protein